MAEDAGNDAEGDAEAEGADAPADAQDDADGKKKPNLVKLGLMVGLPVVILLLACAGAALMFMGGDENEEAVAEAEAGAAGSDAASGDIPTYAFEDPIIVQLNAGSNQSMLLSMKISLESRDPDLGPVIDERMQRVMDQYAAFLRELTPDDLAGSAGMHRVRLELLRRSRLALGEDAVEGVLITEMLVTNS